MDWDLEKSKGSKGGDGGSKMGVGEPKMGLEISTWG